MKGKGKRGKGSPVAAQLFAAGFADHQAGRLAQAQAAYGQALRADPRHVPSLHYLGVLALQGGRNAEAADLIGKAIALDGGDPQSQYNMALALRGLGRNAEAVTHLRRATALRPDFAEAFLHLGAIALQAGAPGEAVTHFQNAVRANPQLPEGYFHLAETLMRFGKLYDALGVINRLFELGLAEARATEALALVRLALKAEENVDTRTLFVQCVRSLHAVPDSPEMRALITRALTEPWGRPADLSAAAGSLVTHDVHDPLLLALLTSAPVRDVALERFLAGARAALLDALGDDEVEFACALARQCFVNEYAFACSDAEQEKIAALRDAVTSGADVTPLKLAVLAAYEPLHNLPNATALQDRAWPPAVKALIDQQVNEPLQEKQIAATLPALTTIDDAVSQAVRAQYEANPYPRWARIAPAGRAAALDDYLLKYTNFRPLGATAPDVLIAGCGTGQHVATVALQFTALNILAIDLSRASLAYAARATRALGLSGIDYAQADIMALGSLTRSFDMIDSSGVLHHLEDPFAGWRVLLSLLRPGGVMRLGFYSALGRRDVAAVRTFVKERGYAADANGIRRCRQDLMGFAPGTPQHAVTQTSDFFSVSECRDLLFHVQEHNLSLPQIAAFLGESGQTFLGFEGCGRGYQRYAQRYPDDASMANLARWAEIENEDPGLFRNMYQFWTQKPR